MVVSFCKLFSSYIIVTACPYWHLGACILYVSSHKHQQIKLELKTKTYKTGS